MDYMQAFQRKQADHATAERAQAVIDVSHWLTQNCTRDGAAQLADLAGVGSLLTKARSSAGYAPDDTFWPVFGQVVERMPGTTLRSLVDGRTDGPARLVVKGMPLHLKAAWQKIAAGTKAKAKATRTGANVAATLADIDAGLAQTGAQFEAMLKARAQRSRK